MFAIRNGKPRWSFLQIPSLKTVGRVAALLVLLVAMMGPWFIDTHPATEESCSAPLIWLGNGYCACLVTYVGAWVPLTADQSFRWAILLLPIFPFLSTILLILGRERHFLWIFHLCAWGMAAVFALFFFCLVLWSSNTIVRLWGAGSGGMLAVMMLVGEIWAVKHLPDQYLRHVSL